MYYKIVVPGPEPGTYLSCHGGTHTWAPGVTYGPVPVRPCYSGFHACRQADLSVWITDGMVVFEVELADVVEAGDKVVGSTATLGRCLGTLTREGTAELARRCAVRAQGYAASAASRAADAYYAARRCAVRARGYAAYAAAAAADAYYAARADADAAAARADADAAAAYAAYAAAAAAADAYYAAARADAADAAAYAAYAAASRNEREQQGRDILSLLVPFTRQGRE